MSIIILPFYDHSVTHLYNHTVICHSTTQTHIAEVTHWACSRFRTRLSSHISRFAWTPWSRRHGNTLNAIMTGTFHIPSETWFTNHAIIQRNIMRYGKHPLTSMQEHSWTQQLLLNDKTVTRTQLDISSFPHANLSAVRHAQSSAQPNNEQFRTFCKNASSKRVVEQARTSET